MKRLTTLLLSVAALMAFTSTLHASETMIKVTHDTAKSMNPEWVAPKVVAQPTIGSEKLLLSSQEETDQSRKYVKFDEATFQLIAYTDNEKHLLLSVMAGLQKQGVAAILVADNGKTVLLIAEQEGNNRSPATLARKHVGIGGFGGAPMSKTLVASNIEDLKPSI